MPLCLGMDCQQCRTPKVEVDECCSTIYKYVPNLRLIAPKHRTLSQRCTHLSGFAS